jgi:hypothetical protein
MRTTRLFGEEYICISDGRVGAIPMLRYDGASCSLVGAGAPGRAPTVTEHAVTHATGDDGLLVGRHSCVVVFVNARGDVSGWSPVGYHDFVYGDRRTNVVVPMGPPDTVQRIVAITPKDDPSNFMYTAKTVISENRSEGPYSFDLSEDELLTGALSVTRWLTSFVPWAPAGAEAIQERVAVWGSIVPLQPGVVFDPAVSSVSLDNYGFRNLTFDGGWHTGPYYEQPNGWTAAAGADGFNGERGGADLDDSTATPFYEKCFRIRAGVYTDPWSGATSPTKGKIYQTVRNTSDYIRATDRYTVTLLMRASSGWNDQVRVSVVGNPGSRVLLDEAFSLTGIDFAYATPIAGKWIAVSKSMAQTVGVDLTSLTITVQREVVGGAVGQWCDLRIAISPADDKQHLHTMSVSESGRPGTFVGQASQVSVGPDDGEGIRNVFKLRDNVFIAKERSLHAVTSTVVGDPVSWSVGMQDPDAGTPSVHGVAVTDSFALIASRVGLYLFDGASPRLVSTEIEGLWRSAAWTYGRYASVVVDKARRVAFVALPEQGSVPDAVHLGAGMVLRLDFVEGWDSPVPSGSGYKWSRDTFAAQPDNALSRPRVMASALVLDSNSSKSPVFAMGGVFTRNETLSPSDFSAPTWTFSSPAPAVTTGRGGRCGLLNATRWVQAAPYTASRATVTAAAGRYVTVAFFLGAGYTSDTKTIALSLSGSADTLTFSFNNSDSPDATTKWFRVLGSFLCSAGGAHTLTVSVSGITTITLCDFLCRDTAAPYDGGYNAASSTIYPLSSVLAIPSVGLRHDFCGEIATTYETAPFGEELGRSTFDACIVRASGSGYMTAQYNGLGTRSWAMTQLQLSENPDEDFEFGADLKSPSASLLLGTSGYDSWFIVNRVGVANKPDSIGWQRGRNG